VTSEDRDPTLVQQDDEGSRSSRSWRDDDPPRERRRRLSIWEESGILVVVAIVLALVVKQFFFQAFYIPSESMEPGLVKNDRILVEKPSYWFGQPQRGDVIVFSDPGGWLDAEESSTGTNPVTKVLSKVGLYPSGGHLVKRVIGVPGDTITCCTTKGWLEVNGHPLQESSYARPGVIDGKTCYGPMPGACHWSVGPVPAGFLFVMGDNRAHSADSSYHLCEIGGVRETDCTNSPWVPEHDVVGKVAALIWPPGRAHVVERPSDFSADLAP